MIAGCHLPALMRALILWTRRRRLEQVRFRPSARPTTGISSPRDDSREPHVLLSRLGANHPIQTPRPPAREGEIEEDEAIEDGGVAAVKDREEPARRVAHPVGDRHLAREQERHWTREQAKHQQRAADEFQHAAEAGYAEQVGRGLSRR